MKATNMIKEIKVVLKDFDNKAIDLDEAATEIKMLYRFHSNEFSLNSFCLGILFGCLFGAIIVTGFII